MVKVLPKSQNKNRKILIPFSLYKRSLLTTYRKLPEQLLKLSVLKLDGSSFSFYVARNATVGRLKSAIEEEFSLCYKDEGIKLWSLVWSHFCLCYEDQKLIKEKDCIQNYGIKDGDQLHFIQHLRIDHPRSKARSVPFSGCEDETEFSEPSHSLKELISCSNFRGLKRRVYREQKYSLKLQNRMSIKIDECDIFRM